MGAYALTIRICLVQIFTFVAADKVQLPSLPTTTTFPKMFHFIWPNKNFTFDGSHKVEESETLHFVSKLKQLHPDWTFWVWTDSECEELVKSYKPDFMPVWKALSPRLKMWDAIRPLILKMYGGIYIDADVSCQRPFTSILTTDTKVLLRANWHKTLGYITKFESKNSVASGNHIMGSVPQHPIWDIYLRKIVEVQQEDPSRTVTKHTGNSQLENSVIEYLNAHPNERDSFKLMDLSEFENSGECERMDQVKYNSFQRKILGYSSCNEIICTHMHALSPVEAAGGDDNAKGQIRKSRVQNLQYKKSNGSGSFDFEGFWVGALIFLAMLIVLAFRYKKIMAAETAESIFEKKVPIEGLKGHFGISAP